MAEYGNNYDYGESPFYKDDDDYGTIVDIDESAFEGDIKLIPNDNIVEMCDIKVTNGDLERDSGLETAVIISLFTNKRADKEDISFDNMVDKMGYWGDVLDENEIIGSKLWLLSRHKNTPELLAQAEEYAKEALDWMKKDGIADAIDVIVQRHDLNSIKMFITIKQSVKSETLIYRYYYNWMSQIYKRI